MRLEPLGGEQLNGIVAVPVMLLVMLLASQPRVMGPARISRRLKVAGWSATSVMAVASVAFFLTLM